MESKRLWRASEWLWRGDRTPGGVDVEITTIEAAGDLAKVFAAAGAAEL